MRAAQRIAVWSFAAVLGVVIALGLAIVIGLVSGYSQWYASEGGVFADGAGSLWSLDEHVPSRPHTRHWALEWLPHIRETTILHQSGSLEPSGSDWLVKTADEFDDDNRISGELLPEQPTVPWGVPTPAPGEHVRIYSTGWPFPCLMGWEHLRGTNIATFDEQLGEAGLWWRPRRPPFQPFPYGVYWPGLLADVAFFFGVVVCGRCLFSSVRYLRSQSRSNLGQCPRCGYRTRVAPSRVCPECGEKTPIG